MKNQHKNCFEVVNAKLMMGCTLHMTRGIYCDYQGLHWQIHSVLYA